MRVLVVGSGAREHALARALARGADVLVTPGNPGMDGRSPEGFSIRTTSEPPERCEADLAVVGPEAPLVAGLADRLRARGMPVLGPGADGARLEGSKAFMKDLAVAAGVPTARHATVERLDDARAFLTGLGSGPYVVKTDGLAGGKGVLVARRLEEALADVAAKLSGEAFGDAGRRVVLEEALEGPELSLLVLCDGRRALPLPPAQDYKRLGDGDTGANTGGMGAYSPVPLADEALVSQVMDEIVEPTLAELRRRRIDYRGVLYAGLICEADGPKLVEYNVRLGDPEAEVVLPLLGADVAGLFCDAACGALTGDPPKATGGAAVAVVLAAEGYPAAARTGDTITGLDRAGTVEGVTVLHAATARRGRDLVTAGGRVLTLVGTGADLGAARRAAYEAAPRIEFRGCHYRHDIGAVPATRRPHAPGAATASGDATGQRATAGPDHGARQP